MSSTLLPATLLLLLFLFEMYFPVCLFVYTINLSLYSYGLLLLNFEIEICKSITYRPGRPPKRMTPITTFANMPSSEPTFYNMMNSSLQSIPFPPPGHGGPGPRPELGPQFPHPFLAGRVGGAGGMAALLSRGLVPGPGPHPGHPGHPGPHPPGQENMLEKYGNMLRQLQGSVLIPHTTSTVYSAYNREGLVTMVLGSSSIVFPRRIILQV